MASAISWKVLFSLIRMERLLDGGFKWKSGNEQIFLAGFYA